MRREKEWLVRQSSMAEICVAWALPFQPPNVLGPADQHIYMRLKLKLVRLSNPSDHGFTLYRQLCRKIYQADQARLECSGQSETLLN